MKFTYAAGDRPIEGYTIQKPLGHGGFGEVYFAISDAGKEVALKLVQRFLEVELRGVNQCLNLKHQNLTAIHDVRTTEAGEHWVIMEFVSGESLASKLDRNPGGLSRDDVLNWLTAICGAVEHLHQCGIVHRDLKPSNIFEDQGTVKVGDYGLSKFITSSKRSGQTQSVGTVHYMAPEIGTGRYGREIDIYAIGVILYEMLTGKVPYNGETAAEVLMKHLTAEPDYSSIDPPFRPVLRRMLSKSPEDRFGSAQAVIADLRARLADSALAETGPGDLANARPGIKPVLVGAAPGRPVIGEELGFSERFLRSEAETPFRGRAQTIFEGAKTLAHRISISIRDYPYRWALCILLTLGLPPIPFCIAIGVHVEEFFGWVSFAALSALIFLVWAFLWRKSAPTPRMRARRAAQIAVESSGRQVTRLRPRTILDSLRVHPFAWSLSLFLTLAAFSIPATIPFQGVIHDHAGLSDMRGMPAPIYTLILIGSSFVITLAFCSWMILWRIISPPNFIRTTSVIEAGASSAGVPTDESLAAARVLEE